MKGSMTGIERINDKFSSLKNIGKKAFIAYITAGNPTMAFTKKLALNLEDAGVDILEIGIPFSDPLADGPVIQESSATALKHGVKVGQILHMAASLRKKISMPIVFMTYYNPVYKFGVKKFIARCAKIGIDGIIIPDLPIEESQDVTRYTKKSCIAHIQLIAPTTSQSRVKHIARKSEGFIYYVSMTGVTGAKGLVTKKVASEIKRIKKVTSKPICVGFGISTPKDVRALAKSADGLIVGSAIIQKIDSATKEAQNRVLDFTKKMNKAFYIK